MGCLWFSTGCQVKPWSSLNHKTVRSISQNRFLPFSQFCRLYFHKLRKANEINNAGAGAVLNFELQCKRSKRFSKCLIPMLIKNRERTRIHVSPWINWFTDPLLSVDWFCCRQRAILYYTSICIMLHVDKYKGEPK